LETLQNVFGNATATIFRLVLVVGTLAAAYFFIVKPTLDTTEKAIDLGNNGIEQAFGPGGFQQQIQRTIRQSTPNSIPQQRLPSQVQITRTIRGLSPHQSQQFAKCVQRASGRIPAINRCFRRFSRK
jgi:hypothetical protein